MLTENADIIICILDKEFGFMHVKIQTWFPFLIQVYINCLEMLKHTFDENRIKYKMHGNSFMETSDISKEQELADKLGGIKRYLHFTCRTHIL